MAVTFRSVSKNTSTTNHLYCWREQPLRFILASFPFDLGIVTNTAFWRYSVGQPDDRVSVLEVELFVLDDRVEHDTRIGFFDSGIDEELLDLVVHVVGVGELPDRNNVVVASGLVDRDHVFVLLEAVSDVGQGTPLDFELQNRRHVVAQLAVVNDRGVPLDDTVVLEIRDVVRHRRHGNV